MWYVYILKSKRGSKLYFGYTSDLKRRFKEHNSGEVKSTKTYKPYTLVYYEAFLAKQDAQERERQIKRYGKALSMLKKRIKFSLRV